MSTPRIGVLSALRRWWPLVALLTGTGGLLGYAYASSVTPVYEADTALLAEARGATVGGHGIASDLVPTYAELVKSVPVLEAAITRLGLPVSPEELAPDVRGESDSETRLLRIRARYRDPSVAVELAEALALELRRFVHENRPRRRPGEATAAPTVRLRILERNPNPARVRPETGLTMEFGAAAGFFAALAVAMLVELRGRRVRDERDLERTGVPVLGADGHGRGGPAVSELGPPPRMGLYELLAARISPSGNGGAPRSLLVLGTQAGDGSAVVALRLAAALAKGGTRVAVLDLGRRREIVRLAGLGGRRPRAAGKRVGALRHGEVAFDRFKVGRSRLLVLAAPRAAAPGRTSWEQAEALVGLLHEQADFVVVRAPSLRRSPDALAWARAVDGTALVVRRGRTKRDSVASALESLEHVRTNVIGTVLYPA